MSESTPKTIKVREASVTSMIKANGANSGAKRKFDKTGQTCWAQTVLFLHKAKPFGKYDTTLDEDVIKEQVRDVFKAAFLDAAEVGEIEIPEKGVNARNGNTMDVTDKDGMPKWSSWDGTRNSISICGEIGRLIKVGVAEQLIISENEVLAKGDANKLKPGEAPLDTIERSIVLIKQKFGELEGDDVALALALLEECYTACASPATGTDG